MILAELGGFFYWLTSKWKKVTFLAIIIAVIVLAIGLYLAFFQSPRNIGVNPTTVADPNLISELHDTSDPSPSPTKESTASSEQLAVTTVPDPLPASGSSQNSYIPTIESFYGYNYAFVPEGPVMIGSDDIYVDDFWIGIYEVTNRQFTIFLNRKLNNTCQNSQQCIDSDFPLSRIHWSGEEWVADEGYENHPVVAVSWEGANDFCNAIEARLPTSIEWFKAASWHPDTGEIANYPWGFQSPDENYANFNSYYGDTLPVGSLSNGRSVIGAYEMLGNVWEYIADSQGVNRIWKGGSWLSSDVALGVTQQGSQSTKGDVGFRCVR